MAGGKSDNAADKALQFFLRTGTPTKPSTLYLALASADLTEANLTANELPIGTGGYNRFAIAVADANWTAPATSGGKRVCSNVNTLNLFTATANLNSSNPIGYWGLYDASTGGNLVYLGAFDTPRAILSGDPAQVAAGALVIRER